MVLKCPTCDSTQTDIPNVVIEAGSRMKPCKPRKPLHKWEEPTIPPIGESFTEGLEKLLRAKTPKRTP